MSVRAGLLLLLVAVAGGQRLRPAVKRADDGFQSVPLQDNSLGALSSFAELLEASRPKPEEELQKNMKTYIVTKKVPVPYPVQFETRVPYPVKYPIRRPYTVYVPKPYYVEVPKPMPYTVKVPVPQPYHIEKHIAYPYKVPIDKPVPIHVSKPIPFYVEKNIPIPVEKHVPVQIKMPVERPYPVHLQYEKHSPFQVEKPRLYPMRMPVEGPYPVPVERPVPVPVERPVPVPLERPVPVPAEASTTYEVQLQTKEEQPNSSSKGNQEYSTPPKTDFLPSPSDASDLVSQGKTQNVISLFSSNNQNWLAPSQESFKYEPSNLSDQTAAWLPLNSTNDWVPRYVTSVQNNVHPAPLKMISSTQQTVIETSQPKSSGSVENQQPFSNEVNPAFQNQVYNFFVPTDKKMLNSYSDNSFDSVQGEIKKKEGDGNYQFFNVHHTLGAKSDPQISGISYQKFESEAKTSEMPASVWTSLTQNVPQFDFKQGTTSGQETKKEDTSQKLANTTPQQAPGQFDPHNYHQYKVYYQGPNQDHFQNPQTSLHNFQPGFAQQDLTRNQFQHQHFPQLQQYEQQQYQQQPLAQPQPTAPTQQYRPAYQQYPGTQYLQQTVVPARSGQSEEAQHLEGRQRRRRQRQPTSAPDVQAVTSSDRPDVSSTTETAPKTKRTRRRHRKRANNNNTAISGPETSSNASS